MTKPKEDKLLEAMFKEIEKKLDECKTEKEKIEVVGFLAESFNLDI
jgi:hypothetical protein